MKELSFKKALLVRLDRIGDLVLSLPVDQMRCFSGKDVTWAVTSGLEFLAEDALPKRKHISLQRKFSWTGFKSFYKFLRDERFDLVVAFHSPAWVALAIFLARVRIRVGVKSQWYSFFTYNRGVRQKRSQALFHESDYNRRLVVIGLRLQGEKEVLKPLKLQHAVRDDRHKLGLRFTDYVVVHPGMGGSARNWTLPLYIEFVKKLLLQNNVVLTASSADRTWVDPIIEAIGEHPKLQWIEISDPEDWRFILTFAKAVVAPSTGTVHVAAALGTPTIGIYSPVKVQSPKRWGPIGEKVKVVWPDVECPGHHSCLQQNCPRFDCMRDITVEEIMSALKEMTKGA